MASGDVNLNQAIAGIRPPAVRCCPLVRRFEYIRLFPVSTCFHVAHRVQT